MGELKYSMDILAPKHKITIVFEGKYSPSLLRNMPNILSSVLEIPLYKVYEDVIQWDVSPGEKINIYCKWTASETEVDAHSTIRIVVEAKGNYFPKQGGGKIELIIKGFVDTTFEYRTVLDKKLKEQYVKTLYHRRRMELRKIGRFYIEKLDKALRKILGVKA